MRRVCGLFFILVMAVFSARGQSASAAPSPVTQSSETALTAAIPKAASKPDPQAEVLNEALKLFHKGDFDHAIEKYQQVLKQDTSSAPAYAGLTRVYLKKKDVKQAYETATKGQQVADGPSLRVALGEVYYRQGKFHEADSEWVRVINAGHQEARAYLGLARLRRAMSKYKTARALQEKAYQLDSTDPDIRRRWVARLSRTERIRFWEQYLASDNNDDEETRAGIRRYLDYWKVRAKDSRGGCHMVSRLSATEMPLLHLDYTYGAGLPVEVNGKRAELLLDTGASGITITRRMAEKAGLAKLSDLRIGGVGDDGSRHGYAGLAKSLKIGELEFQDCSIEVIDKSGAINEDGLIGADVFSQFLVDIDFPHWKLRLSELPKLPESERQSVSGARDDPDSPEDIPSSSEPYDRYIAPEMKSYTPIYRFGHDLLIPTGIGDVPPKLFLIDSGSSKNFISDSAAAEVSRTYQDSRTIVEGISGDVRHLFRADRAVLQFAHLRQQNQKLIAFDMTSISDADGTEISGILGFEVLSMLDMKIDYRDGLVDFTYNAKH